MDTIKGHLIIIGGAEDKQGECVILKQARQMLSDDECLTVLTTATENPVEVGNNYDAVFRRLGLQNIQILNINTRDDANDNGMCDILRGSQCVFMTGGDQLRLTSILGGTVAYDTLKDMYYNGGLIMGTSAGASVISSTMVVQGVDNEPARKCTLKMAAGLGLLENVIIDQHFDQRGRFGRLLCGIAENPDMIGIGIDEDTAIKVYPDMHFEIIGTNAVTIIDGKTIKASNVSEQNQNEILAIIGVTVHTLPTGYGFDLKSREVLRLKGESH
ncbi:MAG: cyanophycinase [Clostridiales bacterium 43-6]|nr:MAG: cyanophycinase [Clostridiales bacterium 43-6]